MPEAHHSESLPHPTSEQTRAALFQASRLLRDRSVVLDDPQGQHIEEQRLHELAMQLLQEGNLASVPVLLAAGLLADLPNSPASNGLIRMKLELPSQERDINRLLFHANNIRTQGGKLIFPSENPEDSPLVGVVPATGDSNSQIVFTPGPSYSQSIQQVYRVNQTPFNIAFAPMWLGDVLPLYRKQ